MPGGNKYSVQTKNRFALADSSADSDSGSEDVAAGNFDPYQMIQTATADAVKKTKEDLKNAKKNALMKKVEPAEEKKNDDEKPKGNRNRNNNNRREPRGNQQQRRGPRNERRPKDGEAAGGDGEVAKNNQPLGENNQPRQRRERRQYDRKSGDPKTGRKGEEKRGGAGKGNWGKADKNYDDEEKPTPEAGATGEEKPVEKSADGEAAPEEQENQEPEEPAGPAPISLEEYMASLGVSEAPKNLRKANDGQDIISKNAFRSNKIHKENLTSFKPVERTNNKEYISPENLSFVSRADRGGFFYTDNRRDNNRGDRRERGGNRGGNKGGQPKEFNLKAMKEEAFPSLGGKVAAK